MDTRPTPLNPDDAKSRREAEREEPVVEIPQFDPRDWPMSWLIRVERQHMLNASAVLTRNGLTHREFRLLIELSLAEGSGVGNMAEATTSERSTTSRVVERLLRKKLIVRKSSAEDQRRASLFLTNAGRRKISQSVPLIFELFHEYEKELPRAEMAELVKSLERLDIAVKRVGRKLRV